MSHESDQKKCGVELESGVILAMKGVVRLTMVFSYVFPFYFRITFKGDLVPALLVTGAGPDQDHTLLPQGAEMTILLPHEERRHITYLLHGVIQKNLMEIRSSDPILQSVEMMLMRTLTMVLYLRRSPPPDSDGSPPHRRSPRQYSGSPPGSRSRSADESPARSD
ncbi:hypothetical protein PR202_ga21618 [Eleusine coracana subsp. coracana]|uniref:Uncharacterized protein n=1 Tax=Eleusine coracana subsp. coracana TaxID=191504 RepID=A0AAV5D0X8_ELECO|nr:hypothetical protein PR202_ga21618 [Eleusine coracana subsp. coracana]